jgi:phenylacetic acid degradation operon negative regulatory protein
MSGAGKVEQLLAEFGARRPIRAGSLIITLFGDSISQHGNSIWLGSLIRLLENFGLNERLVRTTVYRLCQDDWLISMRVGRRSFYSYSDSGLRHYQKAARRIYGTENTAWDGNWTVVLAGLLRDRERDRLRKELRWLGFGTLAPGLMAHPSSDRKSLDETLQETGYANKVVVLSARTEDLASQDVIQQLAFRCWDVEMLERRYRDFINQFKGIKTDQLSDAHSFALRTLLIHEYRRILLRDADLPRELLPEDWSGFLALRTTAELYRSLRPAAERHLMTHAISDIGALPCAVPAFSQRFGGLSA